MNAVANIKRAVIAGLMALTLGLATAPPSQASLSASPSTKHFLVFGGGKDGNETHGRGKDGNETHGRCFREGNETHGGPKR